MKNKKLPKPSPSFNPDDVANEMDFDSLEDKIRGDDLMLNSERKRAKEKSDINKKLQDEEVSRRLEELKKKIGKE